MHTLTFIVAAFLSFSSFSTAIAQIYHPVSTKNPEAQKNFDIGLTYVYAYNHDLAFHAFEKAAQIDPTLAMAYWGMALALGQNVNTDVTKENELKCYNYIQKALELSFKASSNEKAYISTLAVRYTNNPSVDLTSLRTAYRDAMKKLHEKYPEDLDASTLYAESILQINPWKWWTPAGKPTEGILEASDVLESVLARYPSHIGANHYYIHAWEESPTPERALMSAYRLLTLLPDSGHLLHMPCHIFLLVGEYDMALKTNLNAIAQDRSYIQRMGLTTGPYPLHYLTHNMYVLSRIYMLKEDYIHALQAALDVVHFIEPHLEMMPNMTTYAIAPLEIYQYFHKWKEILDYPLKGNTPFVQAYWHFCRALAWASLDDLSSSSKEKELMLQFKKQIPSDDTHANNPTIKIIDLAEKMLDAAVAKAKKNDSAYIDNLTQAIDIQDQFYYDEPPAWYIPVRQVLGFALLQQQRYVEAETAFKKALTHLKRNPRTLYGLSLSLKGQDRFWDAFWVEKEARSQETGDKEQYKGQ